MIKKHFSNGCLKEYVESASVINEWRFGSDEQKMADIMLVEIRDYVRSKINAKEYAKAKKMFAEDVKKIWNLDLLLSTPFKSYKKIASTHMFLEDCLTESNPKNISNRARIKSFLISEITTPKPPTEDHESIKQFLKENGVDDLLLEIAHIELNESVENIQSQHIKEVLGKFAYHTNPDDYIKWLKGELMNEAAKVKLYQRSLSYENGQQIAEVIREIQETVKSIDYENYEEATQKLLNMIELHELLESPDDDEKK